MIIASNNNQNKIFHYPKCKYAARIDKKNLIVFKNKEEARNSGYRHCTHCSRILKYYNKDKAKIDEIILSNGLKMYIDDDAMYIDNTFASWKITVVSDGYSLVLYHGNTESYNKLEKKNGRLIHHYHLQSYRGNRDIMSMLEYIIDHDKWRTDKVDEYKNMPRHTKNQRKAYDKAEKKAKKIKTKNLYNLIDRISLERKEKNKH